MDPAADLLRDAQQLHYSKQFDAAVGVYQQLVRESLIRNRRFPRSSNSKTCVRAGRSDLRKT
jgi:hypothetical protein